LPSYKMNLLIGIPGIHSICLAEYLISASCILNYQSSKNTISGTGSYAIA
jgi:hypothetical protein